MIHHPRPPGRQPRRQSPPWFLLLALVACGCSPKPYKSNIDAVGIVRQNSTDAFAVAFRLPDDAEAFRTFAAGIAPARNRAELTAAWRAVAPLAAKGADFLHEHVFALAMREQRWPKDAGADTLEPSFAEGVQLGVQDFLARK